MQKKNIPQVLTPLIALLGTYIILYSAQAHAELKYNLTGELGTSVQYNKSITEFAVDKALIGFRARTPMGYGVVNIDFAQTTDTRKLLHEAYIHKPITTDPITSVRLGLQEAPFGMHAWDGESIFISDSFNQRLGLYQVIGLTGQLKMSNFILDGGVYNAATRAEITPKNTNYLSNVKDSSLLVIRSSYQKGNILNVQGSYAVQNYRRVQGKSLKSTKLFDLGVYMTVSPLWGFTANFTEVKHIHGETNNTQATKAIRINWTPDHLWNLFAGIYQLSGSTESKAFLWGGFKYRIDNHNQILLNLNLDGNKKTYKGLFKNVPAKAELQYQVKF